MMIFDETAKWKCLGKFFQYPEKEFYVNDLARKLRISAGSASRICRELKKEGIIKSEEKGRALFYSLKSDEPLVRRLKSAWFIDRIMRYRDCWEDGEVTSAALYGSRASGEFVSKSDIDMLIISNADRETIEKRFGKMRENLELALTLTVFTVAEWRKMAMQKDRFYLEVLSSHILLAGSPLVVG